MESGFYSLRVVTEVSPSVSGVPGDLELYSPTYAVPTREALRPFSLSTVHGEIRLNKSQFPATLRD